MIRTYRLTLLFAVTAVVVIAIGAVIVSYIIGKLAQDNLAGITEENASRTALHIESMMTGPDSLIGRRTGAIGADGQWARAPLTLELLTGADGLPTYFRALTMGANIDRFDLLDPSGTIVWSTKAGSIGGREHDANLFRQALNSGVVSRLTPGQEAVSTNEGGHPIDVVETYLPIREPTTGKIIGVMDLLTDVAGDVSQQVDDAKSTALWTTVVTMAGLFLVLIGFIVAADVTLQRSRRRELAVVQEANRTLEDQVRQRTRELAASNETALAATQAKSEFLASMSHELRTPLNAIIGYSEMLQEQAEDEGKPDFIPDLQKVNEAGLHLLELVNGVLDLSRVEAGRMELYLETFRVSEMVNGVVDVIRPLTEPNSNILEVHCEDNAGLMRADRIKVRQTLLNLLSNACKFTEYGTITFDAIRKAQNGADWLSFIVADTGIGMTPEQVGKLFEPFSQIDAAATRRYGGAGLGLALSRSFSQMMGGHITVESEAGKGSTFTFSLPAEVVERGVAPEPVEGPGSEMLPEGASMVLVIDDDPVARDLMERFLVREGFRVARASGGEEGLRLARELRPDVITLDVLMPQADGWSVLTELKADPELAEIPVIMVTIVDDANLGYMLGASEYMTKPIDRERLAAVLKKYRPGQQPYPVLVVENDEYAREMIRLALEREGWSVTEAEDGRVGLERIAESRPELILLDLIMPNMDGFEFIEELRKHEQWRSIPVVVVTAMDLTEEDRLRLNVYVEQIIDKGSYSREELLQEVLRRVKGFVRMGTSASSGRQP